MLDIQIYDDLPLEIKQEIKKLRLKEYVRSPKELLEHEDKYIGNDNFKTIVALQKGKPISRVKLFKRAIIFNGDPVVLGGIGGVWTRKTNRRTGLATSLLQKGLELLKETNCDVAFLNTNIKKLGPLYGRFGFQVLGHLYTFTGKSGKSYFESNGMIAPVGSLDIFYKITKDTKPLDLGHGSW